MIGQGATLSDLYEMLRAELGDSLNMAHSVDEMRPYAIHLNNAQRNLYDGWNWQGFDVEADIALEKGQAIADLPADVDISKISSIHARDGSRDKWVGVDYGIRVMDMNIHDLDETEGEGYDFSDRADPVQKIDIVSINGEQKIKVWPRPKTDAVVRVKARRALPKLVNLTDRCILDPQMIVLRAAHSIASRRSGEDARVLASALRKAAAERYSIVRADNAGPTSDGFDIGLSGLPIPARSTGRRARR